MMLVRHTTAFTLIELLVVIAIITLLIGISVPSMSRAREQSKSAVCLSNMRQIAILLQAYAAEDRSNQPVPIHPMMLRPTGQHYLYATANSFVWAGRDGQRALLKDDLAGEVWLSSGPNGYKPPPGSAAPVYGAAGRPLNRYQLGSNFTNRDYIDMPLYRCPADVGCPAGWGVEDIPSSAYDVPCYDVFGNSYRANTYSFVRDDGALSMGAWGHRMDTLPEPAELVLATEATFFAMRDLHRFDWHHRDGLANVMFVDGSTRATRTAEDPPLDDATATLMDLMPGCNPAVIRTGAGWRLDTWPTPGARIWGDEEAWTYPFTGGVPDPSPPICKWKRPAWPFEDFQRNLK